VSDVERIAAIRERAEIAKLFEAIPDESPADPIVVFGNADRAYLLSRVDGLQTQVDAHVEGAQRLLNQNAALRAEVARREADIDRMRGYLRACALRADTAERRLAHAQSRRRKALLAWWDYSKIYWGEMSEKTPEFKKLARTDKRAYERLRDNRLDRRESDG
jgi:hypothetical protein